MKVDRTTYRVFISGSARDVELTRDIARRLQAVGLCPVGVPEGVTDITERKKALLKSIRGADAVVMLVTPAAVVSPWLMTEHGMADAFGKLVLPVVASLGEEPLPEPLQSYEIVPFDQLDEAISRLKRELASAKG